MKIQGIYKIRNCINGKVYIGQSIDIYKRFKRHKINSRGTIIHPVYNAIKSYGIDNFEFLIIEKIEDINKLDEREQYWMDFYQSYNRDFGYNLRPKAESTRGYKATKETRHKQSIAKKGKITWNKGLKMSEDYCKKLSEAHKGQKSSKETIRKIVESRKWYKHSPETILKIGLGNKGKKRKPLTEEHKLKLRLASTGRKHSEATKKKISLLCRGIKKKRGDNYKHSPETRLKIGLGNKGKLVSAETKLKMSLSAKNRKIKLQCIGQKQLDSNIIKLNKAV